MIRKTLAMAFAITGVVAFVTPAISGHQNKEPWGSPTGSKFSVNYGFFDSRYPDPIIRHQHTGLDLNASAGDPVYAPVTGWIVVNNTDVAVGNARLVFRDNATREEHVLGHISSSLPVCSWIPCRLIRKGEKIGTVKTWIVNGKSNAHVHWGVHKYSVSQGSAGAGWNWGQAPLSATRAQAVAKGWIDMNQHIANLRR